MGCGIFVGVVVGVPALLLLAMLADQRATTTRLGEHPWRGPYIMATGTSGDCLWTPTPTPTYQFIPRGHAEARMCAQGAACFTACATRMRDVHTRASVTQARWNLGIGQGAWLADSDGVFMAASFSDEFRVRPPGVSMLRLGPRPPVRAFGSDYAVAPVRDATRGCIVRFGVRTGVLDSTCPEENIISSPDGRFLSLTKDGLHFASLDGDPEVRLRVRSIRPNEGRERDVDVCTIPGGDLLVLDPGVTGAMKTFRCDADTGACTDIVFHWPDQGNASGREWRCGARGVFTLSNSHDEPHYGLVVCSRSYDGGATRCGHLPRAIIIGDHSDVLRENNLHWWQPVHLGRVIVAIDGVPRAIDLHAIE